MYQTYILSRLLLWDLLLLEVVITGREFYMRQRVDRVDPDIYTWGPLSGSSYAVHSDSGRRTFRQSG